MNPNEDTRDDADDETKPVRVDASGSGPPPGSVSGGVRVSGRSEQAAAAAAPAPPAPGDREESPGALADASFPTVWRGYDTAAVDAYVRRVAQAVTALEETRTPQDVVRRALDRVGEETSAILQEAEEAAQRITTKSRSDSADRVQKAEREAHDITQRARARLRELDADIDRIWIERQRIIDDTRKLADRLCRVADQAEERFPPEDAEGPGASPPATASGPRPVEPPTEPVVFRNGPGPAEAARERTSKGARPDRPPPDGAA